MNIKANITPPNAINPALAPEDKPIIISIIAEINTIITPAIIPCNAPFFAPLPTR